MKTKEDKTILYCMLRISNEICNVICIYIFRVLTEEAVKDDHWYQTMDEEMHAIKKNKTWELTTLPYGKKPIGVKWIYKTKYKPIGEIDCYKVRLVVKGYKQKVGIDYFEVFAPVARFDLILFA